jgi:LytS/YehU family sensor histidine kinase
METKDDSSGIGLVNVKRRVELLYKDQHVLNIDDSGTQFEVTLDLPVQRT